nr:uncharacterized protein LOC129258047 [Lytechinus pictus]
MPDLPADSERSNSGDTYAMGMATVTMDTSLSASKAQGRSLQQCLDSFLLTYRSTKHATTGQTPAGLFLGRELRTRLSLVRPSTKDKVINKQSDQKLHHDKQHGLREFFPGDRVLVKDFRQDETWWSGTVAERRAPKSYVVILEDGRVWKRHVDQLRSECKVSMDDSTHTQVPTPSAHVGPTETLETERHLSAPESLEGNHSPIQADSQIEDDPDIMPPNSGEVLPLRRSKRVRKTPDRLIESM